MKKVKKIGKARKLRGKTENEGAITLVALVVTIIVLLILAGVAISLSIGNNGIISRGELTVEGNKLASYKEKLEMYKAEKIMENENFLEETLSAGTDYLQYNTKKAEEKGTIKTIIPEFEDKYLGKLEVIKGELFLTSTDKKEVQAAKIAGIEFNPYDVTEDGELQSSNTNLELMSPDGTLTIPSNVSKIGYGAFSNVEGLKTIIIPGTCKIIGEKAFANNETLERVIIQDGVKEIEQFAFKDCINLRTVEMADTVTKIGDYAFFMNVKLQSINISKNVKKIAPLTFNKCSMEAIEIPNGVEAIEGGAFSGCDKLQSINFPESLKVIDPTAFQECSSLTNIDIDEMNKNFLFEDGILMNADKNEMIIIFADAIKDNILNVPNGIKTLQGKSLSVYPQIKTINIPSSVTFIDAEYIGRNIIEINIDKDNRKYETYKNGIYEKTNEIREKLIRYYGTEENIIIEDGIKSIGRLAFREKNITNIKLPDSLEEIDSMAFEKTKGLTSLKLGSNVKKLDPLFIYDSAISNIEIAEKNQNYIIENNILYNKDKTELILPINPLRDLTNFNIPEGVKVIGDKAFHNQDKLIEIEIPESVEEIKRSFNYCRSLTKIEIPNSVNKIEGQCFDYCINLNEIKINKEKGSIEGSPWGADKGDKAVIWLK